MQTKNQEKVKTVFIISVFWALASALSFINQYYFIYDLIEFKKLSGSYEFWPDFIGSSLLGLIGGLVFGYILVFIVQHFQY
ncbi:MAG: hypothetical protein IPH62_19995 [Ignavibacteriae bacterium]|nr:hypothetical protein [Ignavibacteriota bacterium]